MKNAFLVVATAALFLITISSCRKDVFQITKEATVVYTDNPPQSLFSKDQVYGVSYKVWIDSAEMGRAQNQGNKCNNYYDPSTGGYVGTDCGLWFTIPVKKYWGIEGDVQYVSKSEDWYTMAPAMFLQTVELIKRKKTGIGYICVSCQNPVGVSTTITYVE